MCVHACACVSCAWGALRFYCINVAWFLQRSNIYRDVEDVKRTTSWESFSKPSAVATRPEWFRARRRDKRRESSAVRMEKLGRCAEDGGRCVVRLTRLVLWFCEKHERTTVRWCVNTCERRLGCTDTGVRATLSRTRVRSWPDRGGVDQFVYEKRHRRSCLFGLLAVVEPRHPRRRRVSHRSQTALAIREPSRERRTRAGGGEEKGARTYTHASG